MGNLAPGTFLDCDPCARSSTTCRRTGCHTLWPVSPSETHIICEWFFDPAVSHVPGFDPDDAVHFWDMTNRQDWQVCELSQLGVSSRRYSPSPYCTSASLLAAFNKHYLSIVDQ